MLINPDVPLLASVFRKILTSEEGVYVAYTLDPPNLVLDGRWSDGFTPDEMAAIHRAAGFDPPPGEER